jgi:hypothetical protein
MLALRHGLSMWRNMVRVAGQPQRSVASWGMHELLGVFIGNSEIILVRHVHRAVRAFGDATASSTPAYTMG